MKIAKILGFLRYQETSLLYSKVVIIFLAKNILDIKNTDQN